MRRTIVMLAAGLLGPALSWAQTQPMIPIAAVREGNRLTGKPRITYLLRQIDLTEEQREYAQTLFDTILGAANLKDKTFPIEKVYQLLSEAEDAREQGDKEREEKIAAEIRKLGQNLLGDEEFFMNMNTMLTDEQKAALDAARERLKRAPSGALRPIDVFRAVYALDPTEAQQGRLYQTRHAFIQQQRRIRELRPEDRFQLMNRLLQMIKTTLDKDRWERLNVTIARLRPDLATSLVIEVPKAQLGYSHEKPDEQANEPSGSLEKVEKASKPD